MTKQSVVKIGFVGLGVVGQGVWKHLEADLTSLEERLGVRIELSRAAVSDLNKKRGIEIDKSLLTTDPMAVARDPQIDILCELMGGVDQAKTVTLAAFETGKTVVSANKALICDHGAELFEVARAKGCNYFFEASVAGGIPIIKSIREGLVANRFPCIYGILNGTCNYILTRMEREQLGFEEIVQDARRLGYVEADESLDLDGWDTAHKTVILTYLAHSQWVPMDKIAVEGIRKISLEDISVAKELGYKIKLLGIVTHDFVNHSPSVRIHPALLPLSNPLATVDDVYNAVSVKGDIVGSTLYVGRGAGQDATASAVISDIVDAIVDWGKPSSIGMPSISQNEKDGLSSTQAAKPMSEFYLRFKVIDQAGVLADVATIMARHNISIDSVLQRPISKGFSQLILTTHKSEEEAMQKALKELEKSPLVKTEPFLLRIIDF